jgi:hypothetical protein
MAQVAFHLPGWVGTKPRARDRLTRQRVTYQNEAKHPGANSSTGDRLSDSASNQARWPLWPDASQRWFARGWVSAAIRRRSPTITECRPRRTDCSGNTRDAESIDCPNLRRIIFFMFCSTLGLCPPRSFLQRKRDKPGYRTWRKAIDWADSYERRLRVWRATI